jgi:hypothetical protein
MRLGCRPDGPTGVAQVGDRLRHRSSIDLPEHVLRLAQAEYEHQHGTRQDYERMQERMGLSVTEVIALLADLAERHGAKPTLPRPIPGEVAGDGQP